MTRICSICGKEFEPGYKANTRRFCYECSPPFANGENKTHNNSPVRRAIKKQLVKYKGGKCEICGYDKCLSALHFHHKNPNQKDFSLSDYTKRNKKVDMSILYEEVDKCILVCANCHAEIHDRIEILNQMGSMPISSTNEFVGEYALKNLQLYPDVSQR